MPTPTDPFDANPGREVQTENPIVLSETRFGFRLLAGLLGVSFIAVGIWRLIALWPPDLWTTVTVIGNLGLGVLFIYAGRTGTWLSADTTK